MVDLGTLPGGTGSSAAAINALGVIVGVSIGPAGAERAFVYRDGVGMADLNGLIGPGSGWTLTAALGINDLGQIVGVGTRAGGQQAFLLTPVPEPTALALAGGAALAGMACRRRRPVVGAQSADATGLAGARWFEDGLLPPG
jgi:probable HAF family extracellular repeat protein